MRNRFEVTLLLDDGERRVDAERADQLVLEVPLARVEAERRELRAVAGRREPVP